MTFTTPLRFFCVTYDGTTVEITESCFTDLMAQSGGTAPIEYDRNTVFDNGVAQVCLTLVLDNWPHADDLQTL